MKRTIALLGLALLATSLACEEELTDPGDNNPPGDETFEMWARNFAKEYAERDSSGYTAYLDPSYVFELLASEVDPDVPSSGWWDRTEELEIAGRMFTGRYNDDGIKVNGIDLALQLKTTPVVDNDYYQDKPEGETWYLATTYVDLTVVTQNPNATDGSGFVNYIVNCDQKFVLRRDPSGSGRYLVRKQTDRPPINKALDGGGDTEESSWGGVKSLFR
ncbi:MAG: hypothetical protein EHM19_09675 [Candidatus Latescibacterota bacterium]|nr:MAG: hypothetical protein EHM19_09675 [Candidatus Latescibacterota bacterium]